MVCEEWVDVMVLLVVEGEKVFGGSWLLCV